MQTWLVAVLTAPALLLGGSFPGFGVLPREASLPPPVVRAVDRAALPVETGGRVSFNNPHGPRSKQYKLVREVNTAIRSARRGATVRLTAYSFAMASTAQALRDVHRRGVRVQVVVDDHSEKWGSVNRLKRQLGTNTSRRSFVSVCHRSCRGKRGVLHTKFLTVSDGRLGRGLVKVGSMNLTSYSAERQWNDMYTVADPAIHRQMVRLFRKLARDTPQPRLRMPATRTGFKTDTSPYRGQGADTLKMRLNAVRCRAAGRETGVRGRTVVRIAVHAWNGERGIALARQVGDLRRQGCNVKVLHGSGMGRAVKTVLRNNDVPVRDSKYRGRRVHHKVMLLSGAIGKERRASYVWTGSHNWSDASTWNDELIVRMASPRLVDAYLANFSRMWRVAGPDPRGR